MADSIPAIMITEANCKFKLTYLSYFNHLGAILGIESFS